MERIEEPSQGNKSAIPHEKGFFAYRKALVYLSVVLPLQPFLYKLARCGRDLKGLADGLLHTVASLEGVAFENLFGFFLE